jgi:KaiC/GvpD/RAD55 family RecA-like ATPase
MRGTPVPPGEHPFEITPTQGIVLQDRGPALETAAPATFEYFQLAPK